MEESAVKVPHPDGRLLASSRVHKLELHFSCKDCSSSTFFRRVLSHEVPLWHESLLEASLSSCWTVGFPSQIRFLCSLVLPPSSNEVSLTRRRWVFLILSSKWVYFLFLWPASYINRTTGGSEYVTPLWHPKLWSHEGQLCPRSGWSFWGVKRPQSMYGNSHGRSFIRTADKRRVNWSETKLIFFCAALSSSAWIRFVFHRKELRSLSMAQNSTLSRILGRIWWESCILFLNVCWQEFFVHRIGQNKKRIEGN